MQNVEHSSWHLIRHAGILDCLDDILVLNIDYRDRARERRKVHRYVTYWKVHGRRGSATSPLLKPRNTSYQPQSDSHHIAEPPPDHSRRLQSDSHPITELPAALVAQALTKLPDSTPLFLEALQSADNLDESDLGRWDSRPPFTPQLAITDERSEARFTERLVEVM